MNPFRLQAIVRKEFYHLIRDYRSLYLAFAIPLLLIVLFGYALSLDVEHVKTVVGPLQPVLLLPFQWNAKQTVFARAQAQAKQLGNGGQLGLTVALQQAAAF